MINPDFYNIGAEVQRYVADILNHSEISAHSVQVLAENSKNIEYEIKNSLARTGMAVICLTPKASYLGHDGCNIGYQIDELEIDIAENVPVNRSISSNYTAQDLAYTITDILASPQRSIYGQFCPIGIEVGENGSLLIAKAKFKTIACEDLSSYPSISSDTRIPFIDTFATKNDLSVVHNEVLDLSAIILDFDTEQIKLSVQTNASKISSLSTSINSLSDVYAPLTAEYVYTNDLSNYYNKTQADNRYLRPTSLSDYVPTSALTAYCPISAYQELKSKLDNLIELINS